MKKKQKKIEKEITPENIVKDIEKEINDLVYDNVVFSAKKDKKIIDSLWENERILTFEEFCKSPEHMNFPSLSERQKNVVDYLLGDDPKKMFENNRTTAVLIWGKGCFCGDEELYTMSSRITFEESYKLNIPLIVHSLKEGADELTESISTPSIKKDKKEKCFLVVLSNGLFFKVSEDHKFYTNNGFKKLKDITEHDKIIVKGGYKISPVYNIEEDIAYLLGLLISQKNLNISEPFIMNKIQSLNLKLKLGIEFLPSIDKYKIYINDRSFFNKFNLDKNRIPIQIIYSNAHVPFLKGFFERGFDKLYATKETFKDLFFILASYGILIRYKKGEIIISEENKNKIKKLVNGEIIRENSSKEVKIKKKIPLGEQDVYTLSVPIFHNYLNLGVIHHNSGKDTISALVQLYIVYVLLHLKSPQAFLGLGQASSIDLLNVASTREQAEQIYFQLLKNFILNWKWLKNRYTYIVSGRFFSTPSNELLDNRNNVVITNEAILFPKNIRMFSGSSEADSSEGKNLLCFVLDEADAFKNPSRSAESIYRVCRTSATSRFQNKFKAFIISYPRSNDGFIFNLYRKVENDISFYCDIAATWEVLPKEKFSGTYFEFEGYQIPIEFFNDFKLDPVGSKLVYMCKPSNIVENKYIDIDEIQYSLIDRPRAEFMFKDYEEPSNQGILVKKDIIYVPFDFLNKNYKYVLSFDLAVVEDRSALCLLHSEQDQIIIDFVTAWVPDKSKNRLVDLDNVYKVITDIARIVKPSNIVGDFWNSALLCQRLKAEGYKADILKVVMDDYLLVKRLFLNKALYIPNNPMLLEEISNLVFKKNTVDHPKHGYNDLFMAMVIGIKAIINQKGESGVNLMTNGQFIYKNLGDSSNMFSKENQTIFDDGFMIDKNWFFKVK